MPAATMVCVMSAHVEMLKSMMMSPVRTSAMLFTPLVAVPMPALPCRSSASSAMFVSPGISPSTRMSTREAPPAALSLPLPGHGGIKNHHSFAALTRAKHRNRENRPKGRRAAAKERVEMCDRVQEGTSMLPGRVRHLPGWFRERPGNDSRESRAQDVLRASVMPQVFIDGQLWDINMVLGL